MTARQETGGPLRTPRTEMQPVIPRARREQVGVEPVCLFDISGSTFWGATEGAPDWPDHQSRRYVMTEALRQIVRNLEGRDTEAAGEQASGSDERGGLLTFFFGSKTSDGIDLNSSNFDRRMKDVDKIWGGGTYIMPAWQKALQEYEEEFGNRPEGDRPVHAVVIMTDGELDDGDKFLPALQTAGPSRVFVTAIFGYDDDPGNRRHSSTLQQYRTAADKITASDPQGRGYIKVVSFSEVTDPAEVAEDMAVLLG